MTQTVRTGQAGYQPPPVAGDFRGKHIISVEQFCRKDLDELFEASRSVRKRLNQNDPGLYQLCSGKMMASLFFESSTRTDMSFQSAMRRIGGDVISVSNGIQFSSMYKGENIADTVRAVACYADVIVIRHEQTGTAAEAAVSVDSLKHKLNRHAVVINAGDGVGEHPTQALLDLFTIYDLKKSPDNLVITLVGDLLNGRTVHSLLTLIAGYGVRQTHFNLVSPVSLSMPANLLSLLKQRGISYTETEILDDVIRDTDVLYWTRVQEERFRDRTAYEAIKDRFILLPQTIVNAKPDMIIMHPLPRKHEMGTPADHQVLDTDPRTVYFEQMRNGMYVRMALLAKVIQGAYV